MNLRSSLHRTGDGIVIDIGTGDGRFVSAMAKRNPNRFFIGIDANVKPLEKLSMKATRKANKGGLPNVMFVQAAIEFLPEELSGVANEIHIHFPWGSLLQAIATGDEKFLADLRRIAVPGCLLEIVIGIDAEKDKSEIDRLGLLQLSREYVVSELIPRFDAHGFELVEHGQMENAEWSKLETSWARKLQTGENRKVTYLVFRKETVN